VRSLGKLLRNLIYLLPRLVLFGIFVLCFVITVFISLDYLNPYENPMEHLRAKALRMVKVLYAEEGAGKAK
jgi:hypothetical protein